MVTRDVETTPGEPAVETRSPGTGRQATDSVILRGTPKQVAQFLQTRPGQRDELMRALHEQRGNAFVAQVVAAADHDDGEGELEGTAGGDDAIGGGAGASGSRFARDNRLYKVEIGAETLKLGDQGPAVRKLQQALYDLHYRPISVMGTYDAVTVDRVKNLQHNVNTKRQDGTLDAETFGWVQKGFTGETGLRSYARDAQREAPGLEKTPKHHDAAHPETALMRETHLLAPDEKIEAEQVLTPGKSGKDVDKAPKLTDPKGYETELEAALQEEIDDHHKQAKRTKEKHDDGDTYSMKTIANVGNAAKGCVDTVFGSWATGPKLEPGTTIKDRFESDTKKQKAQPAAANLNAAKSRVRYFMNTKSQFTALDEQHHAIRSRNDEKAIITAVVDRLASKNEKPLLLITATWSAAAERDTGAIKIQRTKAEGEDAQRDQLWGKFYTLIHEYCHTLAHPKWYDFADAKGKLDKQMSHALIEGVTELLTRTVLSVVNTYDDTLRREVEGGLYSKDAEPPDPDRGYGPAFSRAQALVGVIGIHNLYAAYFLGQTHLAGA